MQNRRVYSVAIAALLTGCAANYQRPEGATVSRLRIVAPQTSLSFFSGTTNALTYASGTCDAPMTLGLVGGVGRLAEERPIGIPTTSDMPEKSFIERVIPAGNRELFTVRSLAGNSSCVISFSFVPEAGSDYEARMTWDAKRCFVSVRKVVTNEHGAGVLSKEESMRQEPNCRKGLW
jgi:hypothetical protein